MVIAETHLKIISRNTRARPATALVLIGRVNQSTRVCVLDTRGSSSDPTWGTYLFFLLSGRPPTYPSRPSKNIPSFMQLSCLIPPAKPWHPCTSPTVPTVLASGLDLPHGPGVSVCCLPNVRARQGLGSELEMDSFGFFWVSSTTWSWVGTEEGTGYVLMSSLVMYEVILSFKFLTLASRGLSHLLIPCSSPNSIVFFYTKLIKFSFPSTRLPRQFFARNALTPTPAPFSNGHLRKFLIHLWSPTPSLPLVQPHALSSRGSHRPQPHPARDRNRGGHMVD